MTDRSTHHATFTIERTYDATPARVFKAFADPAAKAQWFAGPADKWKEITREFDFRIGGRERLSGAWPGGMVSHFDGHYLDIVPNERIIYSYGMHLDDRHISISLATVELKPAGMGTRLIFTEQAIMLDGYSDPDARERERGTRGLLDQLGESLRD